MANMPCALSRYSPSGHKDQLSRNTAVMRSIILSQMQQQQWCVIYQIDHHVCVFQRCFILHDQSSEICSRILYMASFFIRLFCHYVYVLSDGGLPFPYINSYHGSSCHYNLDVHRLRWICYTCCLHATLASVVSLCQSNWICFRISNGERGILLSLVILPSNVSIILTAVVPGPYISV
jgi:hypothetical protein